jgi:sulfoacetaldehyde dehydrogenase
MSAETDTQIIDQIVANARKAQAAFEADANQERYDHAALAVGWAIMQPDRNLEMGHTLPTCRVIVNQAHCFATGGSFNNGLPFPLSMGCGSWGGNSIDENLHWKHFLSITKVVHEIPVDEPTVDSIFEGYWKVAGQ